jgi:hypothetical protein
MSPLNSTNTTGTLVLIDSTEWLVAPAIGARQAPLPLQILRMRERILLSRRDCGRRRHHPIRHAEHSDRLELQLLHPVHGANANGVLRRLGRERNGRNTRRFQRRARLLPQPPRPRGDPDRMRLDPSETHPRTRSTSAASSASPDEAACTSGRRPCNGDRYPASESASSSSPVTGAFPSAGTASARISRVVR